MPWLATHDESVISFFSTFRQFNLASSGEKKKKKNDEVCHGQRPVEESMPWPAARGGKYAMASSPKTKVCHGHKLVDESMPWMESGG